MSEEDIIKSIDEYFNLDKVEEGEAFKRGYFSAMYRIKNIWKQLEDKNNKQKEVLDKIKEYIENLLKEELEITDPDSTMFGEKCQRKFFSDSELEKILKLLEEIE